MFRTRILAAAATLVVAVSAAACARSSTEALPLDGPTPPELSLLYEQAQSAGETRVVFYGPQAKDLEPAFDLFHRRFPSITVEAVGLFGPQLDAKVHTEASTGQRTGDLVQVANTPVPFAREGLCQAYRPPNTTQLAAPYSDLGDRVQASTTVPFGLLYNKSKVEHPPKGWNDLVSGSFHGTMAIANPTVGGIADALSAGLQSGTFTPDYLRALHDQALQVVSDGQAVGQAVASGQAGVGLFVPYIVYKQLRDKGIDVGFVFPVEGGTYISPFLNCLLAGSPHPNAAKLLEGWFFSAEAQSAVATLGQYGTTPGAPAPQGLPSLNTVNTMKLPSLSATYDGSAANVAVLKSIF